MRVEAGDLNIRISLERDALTYTAGAEVRTAATYATVWAAVGYVRGSEAWKGHTVNSDVSVTFTIRYRSDVLPTDRVVYDDRRYEIKAIPPDDGRRENLTLECAG